MTMMLRNSEIQCFKKCRHRWQWTYLDGRQAREASTALRFGDLVHRSLEPYYKPGKKRGPLPAETFERLYHDEVARLADEGFAVYSDEKWENALDLGVGMLEGYVARYAEEEKEYEVISSEQTFQLPVRAGALRFNVVGTFDGVWRHLPTDRLMFKEFKTCASIKTDGLPMDEQAGMYWTYGPKYLAKAGILKPDEKLSQILYTFLRKAVPNPDAKLDELGRKLNKDGTISKQQPAPFFARVPVYRDQGDRETLHARVVAEAGEIAAARAGELPLYKNPGPLYMPNCMGCELRDACEVHETGGDFAPILAASMQSWNPYAAHELPERS